MRMLLCAAFFTLQSSLFTSCSEADDTVDEFANWQQRNDAYFEQQYQASAVRYANWSLPSSKSVADLPHTDCIVVNIGTGTAYLAVSGTEIRYLGGTGVGGIELHGCRVGSGGRHHDGVVHGTVVFECLDEVGHGGAFLSDGDIDTIDGVAFLIVLSLVDDGVDGDSGLAGLAVANDELALAAANGNHRVDGLDARL